MNSKLYKRVKECLYLLTFILSIMIKWTYYGEEGPFTFIVSNQIIFFPILFMIGLLYFNYRYYHNTFIQTRFTSMKEVRYNHIKSNIYEALKFLAWQLVIGLILGFHTFSFESFYALTIIVISLVLLYIAYTVIYTTILEITNHYYYAFITCGILLIFYRIVVYNLLGLGSYLFVYQWQEQNYILIVAFLIVISCCILFMKFYFREKGLKKINKNLVMILTCIIAEIFSEMLLQNKAISFSSFSLMNYFELMQGNEMFTTLLWLMPKIVLLYTGFMMFCDRYRLNYTLFAVRIINKRKWVNRIMKEMGLFILIIVISKLVFHCLFYQLLDFNLLIGTIEYFVYISLWMSFLIIGYIMTRNESVFNYMMLAFILMASFIGIMRISELQFLVLNNNVFTVLYSAGLVAIVYNIIVYLINHHEYY